MEIGLTVLAFISFCLLGYLFGSIPFAVLISTSQGLDITSVGSGNPGGTNVWRQLGWKAGLSCMILDFFKGFLPSLAVLLMVSFIPQFQDGTLDGMNFLGYPHLNLYVIGTGIFAMIGHAYPLFFHFKGGKNVMVTCGYIGATCPLMMGIGVILFFLGVKLSHKISVGSLCAAGAVIIYSLVSLILSLSVPAINQGYVVGGFYLTGQNYFLVDWLYSLFLILGALFVILRHKSNIIKLLHHQEKDFDPASHEFRK